jgi:membrane fusion protein (multidrug efflux system)
MVAYFSVSETEYLAYVKKMQMADSATRAKGVNRFPVRLVLADGSIYEHEGKVDFADRAMNSATGTLTLRAVFANSEGLLRPGMNARVRVVADVAENAILVPQKAVSEMLGKQFVTVLGADNKVEQRPIKTGRRLGDMWLVQEGLKAGDVIVVDGIQKARPGTVVKPLPLTAASAPAQAAPGAASAR